MISRQHTFLHKFFFTIRSSQPNFSLRFRHIGRVSAPPKTICQSEREQERRLTRTGTAERKEYGRLATKGDRFMRKRREKTGTFRASTTGLRRLRHSRASWQKRSKVTHVCSPSTAKSNAQCTMAILFNDFNDQLFPKKMDGIGICITLSPSFARESCVFERYLNFRKTTERTKALFGSVRFTSV